MRRSSSADESARKTDGEASVEAVGGAGTAIGDDPALPVLLDTLSYARDRDYTGWDYVDGMSSRIRRWLPVENRWINLAFQETAKRAPVNVRPLLLVERRRNFMAAGLFAMANLIVHRLSRQRPDAVLAARGDGAGGVRSGDVDYAGEAVDLLDWTLQRRCRGYAGFCGAHQHKTQSFTNTGTPATPSVLSTAFPARALLRATDLDPVYGAVGETAADFVITDLAYRSVEDGAVIKYLPTDDWSYLTPNALAIGARLLTDVGVHADDDALLERAGAILDYVVDLQTDVGGWKYREPPSASHLSMDNFHNGFILEALLRYADLVDDSRFAAATERSLSFHRSTLFDRDGAPNWDETSTYPRDVHNAAQGILVFAHAGEFDRARRTIDWTLEHLYAGDGRFVFRKHRLFTKRYTLMRWCQAWMAYALAEYLALQALDGREP